MLPAMTDVTRILAAIEAGDRQAADALLPLVYDELRKLAAQRLRQERAGQTLQPTALVHEAYLRLVGSPQACLPRERGEASDSPGFANRGHFFAAAAEAMRRILVDSARRKKRVKHGGGQQRVDLEDHDVPVRPPPEEILALDEALTRFEAEDPTAAQVVRLHFFAGLSIDQAAEALALSRATAYRHWSYARAWLRCAIGGDGEAPAW